MMMDINARYMLTFDAKLAFIDRISLTGMGVAQINKDKTEAKKAENSEQTNYYYRRQKIK